VIDSKGTIYVMGGRSGSTYLNDVWQSKDGGVTWAEVTADAPWAGRDGHATVIDSRGTIYVMGGRNGIGRTTLLSDVWRSTDGGKTWKEATPDAPWRARDGLTAVIDSSGTIYLLIGAYGSTPYNDVYQSSDGGATWTQTTTNSPWRSGQTAVIDSRGTIYVMGGAYGSTSFSSVWRSTDGAAPATIAAATPTPSSSRSAGKPSYVWGVAGSNDCPAGSSRIADEAACRAAFASGLSSVSLITEQDSTSPKGCYLAVTLKLPYFNSDATGTGYQDTQLLCAA